MLPSLFPASWASAARQRACQPTACQGCASFRRPRTRTVSRSGPPRPFTGTTSGAHVISRPRTATRAQVPLRDRAGSRGCAGTAKRTINPVAYAGGHFASLMRAPGLHVCTRLCTCLRTDTAPTLLVGTTHHRPSPARSPHSSTGVLIGMCADMRTRMCNRHVHEHACRHACSTRRPP